LRVDSQEAVLSLRYPPKQQEPVNAGNVGRPQLKDVWGIHKSRDAETLVKTVRVWTVQEKTAGRNRSSVIIEPGAGTRVV
jgi:hypothetical protein